LTTFFFVSILSPWGLEPHGETEAKDR
jgi:hypothetical protein